MQTPRAPEGTEIYLFPTITVPPTNADAVTNPTRQYGLEPGASIPDDDNRSTSRLGVLGSLLDASQGALPITIAVQGAAAYRQGLQAQVDRTTQSGGQTISDLVKQVARQQRLVATGSPVPRFSVQRNGGAQLGVEPEFVGTGLSALAAPSGYVQATNAISPSIGLVEADGVLYAIYAIEKSGGGDNGKHTLVVYKYDQSADSDWVSFVDETGLVAQDGATHYIGTLNTPQVAAVNYRGDIYAIVADAGTIVTGATGSIYVYRMDPIAQSLIYVSGPVRVGTANGIITNGGIAAAALGDRVVVALGGYASTIVYPEATRSIWIGASSDLTTWSDQTNNEAGFIALDGFSAALPDEADGTATSQTVTKVHFYTTEIGWAVTDTGRIYSTLDAGRTWTRQTSPITTALYDVQGVSGTGDAITVVACGAQGALLRSVDSGSTWLVVSISQNEAANLTSDQFVFADEPAYKSRATIGDQALYALAFKSTGQGWLVGENRIVAASNIEGDDRAGTFAPITPRETKGTYTSVVIVDSTTNVILVGGDIQRERTKTTADKKRYRFLRIVDAINPSYAPGSANHDYYFFGTIDDSSGRINALALNLDDRTEAYACGRKGVLLKITAITTTPVVALENWTQLKTTRNLVSLVFRTGATPSTNLIYCLSDDGILFRSESSANNWTPTHVGSETAGRCIALPIADVDWSSNPDPDDKDVVVIGGGTQCWRTDVSSIQEALPSILALANGELLLATANLQNGRIDFRISRDRAVSWERVGVDDSAALTFVEQTTFSGISDTSLKPSLFLADTGEVMVTGGTGGLASQDNGRTWLKRDDTSLVLPLGTLSITAADWQNRSRQTIAYGSGRLFTISLVSDWETRTARNWTNTAPYFMPVVPGKAQWIGLDDLRVIFSGTTLPVGDQWTIPASYRFPARNLIVETRSQFWRGQALSFINGAAVFEWDRQDPDVVTTEGVGATWNITAAALADTNFEYALLAVSKPTYNGSTFPTDPADYTEFRLSSVIEVAMLTAQADFTSEPYNILRCQGQTWIPSQFRSGVRDYYALVRQADNTASFIYHITDNGPDWIQIPRVDTITTWGVGASVLILTDRMVCLGEGGTRGNQTNVPALIDSPHEFGRWVRLTIPDQPSADAYWKIGSAVLGRHVPITVRRPEGEFERDGMEREFRWKAEVSSIEEKSLSGVSAIEHFGKPVQKWSYSQGASYWWDTASVLSPMMSRMRRAFCLIMDSENPARTAEFVRLSSDSALPEVVHSGQDLYGLSIAVEEIL